MDDPFGDMTDYVPYLKSVAKGRILEIGTRDGVSTEAFLEGLTHHGGHLYSVDIAAGCAGLFDSKLWTFIHSDSRSVHNVMTVVGTEPLDILMIDGDHSYDTVRSDLESYYPFVRRGGRIIMHDVDLSDHALQVIRDARETWAGEPRKAYDEFVSDHRLPSVILRGIWGMGVIYKA